MSRLGLHAGWIAGAMFAITLSVVGAAAPGYDHATMPVSFLGMSVMPVAAYWNVAGFILPGLLVAWFALSLLAPLERDGAGTAARIGVWLLAISGLAYAGNGVFPYDLAKPDELASKLHVAMLTIALLGFLPSALMLAMGLRGRPGWRALVGPGVLLALAVLLSVLQRMIDFVPVLEGNPGYAQRITLVLYFLWLALAARTALSRAATSAPGSPPPARR
ncbi:MAG: DUF998 domain-containing protein [Pseudomonadota bacterium]|nr:DUF998 domain-containing protein [Pseudomonadota bacterium]